MDFWDQAQSKETAVWLNWGQEPIEPLKRRARIMLDYLLVDAAAPISTDTIDAMEIGGAGAPVITLLDFKSRVVVDPIYDNVRDSIPLPLRPRAGDRAFSEPAEDLSFIESGSLDVVFCLNVLDHARDPDQILSEIKRTLRKNGRALISVDCYGPIWLLFRLCRVRLRGKNDNDILHPHHFTLPAFVRMVRTAGLKILRGFIAPGDGFSRASEYRSTSEYPFRAGLVARIKAAGRLYAVVTP